MKKNEIIVYLKNKINEVKRFKDDIILILRQNSIHFIALEMLVFMYKFRIMQFYNDYIKEHYLFKKVMFQYKKNKLLSFFLFFSIIIFAILLLHVIILVDMNDIKKMIHNG